MPCSANGSTGWRYQAWWPARRRCFWSTGAGKLGEGAGTGAKASGFASEGFRGSREAGCKSALRLLRLLFLLGSLFGFLGSFLGRFLASLLGCLPGFLGLLLWCGL